MLVCRLNNCRSPTIGEKYERPLSLSSGANSSLALSCALLVIAPNSAHVVSLSAFTVRSGSAFPSVHQNFQPISQGTYSASNFIRSRTTRAASITSLPTPSPGIHAILYLAIGTRLYRGRCESQGYPVTNCDRFRARPGNDIFSTLDYYRLINRRCWRHEKQAPTCHYPDHP